MLRITRLLLLEVGGAESMFNAGQEGFEPPCGNSINGTYACKRVVNPLPFIYFVIRTLETGGHVCRAYAFHHRPV